MLGYSSVRLVRWLLSRSYTLILMFACDVGMTYEDGLQFTVLTWYATSVHRYVSVGSAQVLRGQRIGNAKLGGFGSSL